MKINFENYDKYLWRSIGTLILIGGIGSILSGLLVAFFSIGDFDKRPPEAIRIDQNTKKEVYLYLGSPVALTGTDLFLIPLTSEPKNKLSSYDMNPDYGISKNILFFNFQSKESHWLWPHNHHLILQDVKIYNTLSSAAQITKALALEYVEADSDKDGDVDTKDLKSIQYYDLATRKSLSIIQNIERSIGIKQQKENEVLFLYTREAKSYYKVLSLVDLQLSVEKEINFPF